MATKIQNKIIDELKNFPEDKMISLLDYIRFLKWKKEKEILNKKGAKWREIK